MSKFQAEPSENKTNTGITSEFILVERLSPVRSTRVVIRRILSGRAYPSIKRLQVPHQTSVSLTEERRQALRVLCSNSCPPYIRTPQRNPDHHLNRPPPLPLFIFSSYLLEIVHHNASFTNKLEELERLSQKGKRYFSCLKLPLILVGRRHPDGAF